LDSALRRTGMLPPPLFLPFFFPMWTADQGFLPVPFFSFFSPSASGSTVKRDLTTRHVIKLYANGSNASPLFYYPSSIGVMNDGEV